MKQILLFGGTFNPMHNGHVALLHYAGRLSFDEICVMPDCLPPHKPGEDLAGDDDRLAMCKLAVEAMPGVTVCEDEIRRGGKSYTVDTLETILARRPADYTVAVGGDMLLDLPHWKRADDLKKLCRILAYGRAGRPVASYRAAAETLRKDGWQITFCEAELPDVSSTVIRQRLKAGGSVNGLVPDAVAAYIRLHRLYETVPVDYTPYLTVLRAMLDQPRYEHSLGVALQAKQLARRYGADEETAYLAGLLHDVTKRLSPDEQQALLRRHDVSLTCVEQDSPQLWHAMTAPLFVAERWGITDRDFLNALRYHTTGRAGMSLLEMIVYLADFSSVDRTYPDVDVVRRLLNDSLAAAALYTLRYTVDHLSDEGRPVHPDTLEAYRALSGKKGETYDKS